MKYLTILIFILFTGCEIADSYTETYRLKYRRPIALLMSHYLDSLELSGRDVKIGVIDAGFGGFRQHEYTKNLYVADYRDFIDSDTTGFFTEDEHDHGTLVTSSIGGKNGEYVHGLAYNAQYFLAKTEDVRSERISEEDRLISAIDWLVSKDVDIINISIAYTTFDDAQYYTREDLDGRTARSSRHFNGILDDNPNLIITVSAGNKGNKEWKNIMVPADVKEVITVGSTDFEGKTRWKSSGVGVDFVDFIKPDVVTYPIPTGNSHTAPVIAGFCALVRELYPTTDRKLLIDAFHKTSSNSLNPNREIGYGVPRSDLFLEYLKRESMPVLKDSIN